MAEPIATVTFPAPDTLLTLNQRMSWWARSSSVRTWRQAGSVYARQAGLRNLAPCIVAVTFVVATNRRRDPHNFIATVKPIVDGFVDAQVWPDDTAEWVAVVDPKFVVDRAAAGTVTVELIER